MRSKYVNKNIEKFSPFSEVQSRELKTLLNHNAFQGDRTQCFMEAWHCIKNASISSGFEIIEAEDPLKEVCKMQEYFDTKKGDLRNAGIVLRKSTGFIDDQFDYLSTLTAKELNKNLYKVLTSKLDFNENYSGETEIEEKVALNHLGELDGYFEVQKKVKIRNDFSGNSLGDFSDIFPYIKLLNIPNETSLQVARLFSHRVYPGKIQISPNQLVKFDIESCSFNKGEKPFVVGCSFTIETNNYYNMDQDHYMAEKFLTEILEEKCKNITLPDGRKWLGSKLRILLSLQ